MATTKTTSVTFRLENHVMKRAEEEAERRGQTMSQFMRNCIQDVLYRYEPANQRILEIQENLENSLVVVEALVGTNIHMWLEDWCRKIPKEPSESESQYLARIARKYRQRLKDTIDAGEQIVKEVSDGKIGDLPLHGKKKPWER